MFAVAARLELPEMVSYVTPAGHLEIACASCAENSWRKLNSIFIVAAEFAFADSILQKKTQ